MNSHHIRCVESVRNKLVVCSFHHQSEPVAINYSFPFLIPHHRLQRSYATPCNKLRLSADPAAVCQVNGQRRRRRSLRRVAMQKTNRRKTAGINTSIKMHPTLRDRITKRTCQWPSSIVTACLVRNGIFRQLKLLLLDIGTHVCS